MSLIDQCSGDSNEPWLVLWENCTNILIWRWLSRSVPTQKDHFINAMKARLETLYLCQTIDYIWKIIAKIERVVMFRWLLLRISAEKRRENRIRYCQQSFIVLTDMFHRWSHRWLLNSSQGMNPKPEVGYPVDFARSEDEFLVAWRKPSFRNRWKVVWGKTSVSPSSDWMMSDVCKSNFVRKERITVRESVPSEDGEWIGWMWCVHNLLRRSSGRWWSGFFRNRSRLTSWRIR